MFPGLIYHMNAADDPNNRVECGGKGQGGTPSAAELISWIKVVVELPIELSHMSQMSDSPKENPYMA